jgi:hypothetical protein
MALGTVGQTGETWRLDLVNFPGRSATGGGERVSGGCFSTPPALGGGLGEGDAV